MSILTSIMENIKVIGGCVGGFAALCGAYVAADGPIPASKQWTLAEVSTTRKDVTEGRLEINEVRRQLLRKEKFDRTMEYEKSSSTSERQLLRERLDWIEGELEKVNKAREDLKK